MVDGHLRRRGRAHPWDRQVILIEGLGKVYGAGRPGAVTALDGVDLAVPDGAIQGVVGPSGSGKSTLLRCLNLLEVPTSGRIVVDGSDLTALSAMDLRAARQISFDHTRRPPAVVGWGLGCHDDLEAAH